ncbi:hypothetical protein [Streptomyces hygroscopicus]|uniref:hypothetical protein n=1 Tax=Streptomyces hygroscopicus TaxID=1912 RepID=UPI0022402216|nr:hypothetical protein [Streptomyces hygroscopicus]
MASEATLGTAPSEEAEAKARGHLERLGGSEDPAAAQWSPSRSSWNFTAATAPHDPNDPRSEAVAAFHVQASGGLGSLYAPMLSLTADDTERPGLLACIHGLWFIRIEPFDTGVALTATGLLHAGHLLGSRPRHPRRPPLRRLPSGRFLLALTPEPYEGTGVRAVHPDQ